MTTQVSIKSDGKLLKLRVSGKLRHEDYNDFVPEFESLIRRYGKVCVLFEMIDFRGWEGPAIWDDVKLHAKYCDAIDRIAMVGDKAWERHIGSFCRLFTWAQIRFFEPSQIEQALAWLKELQPVGEI